MKRLVSVLLLLSMVIPVCVPVQAEKAEIKPFYLLNWSNTTEEYDYVYHCYLRFPLTL